MLRLCQLPVLLGQERRLLASLSLYRFIALTASMYFPCRNPRLSCDAPQINACWCVPRCLPAPPLLVPDVSAFPLRSLPFRLKTDFLRAPWQRVSAPCQADGAAGFGSVRACPVEVCPPGLAPPQLSAPLNRPLGWRAAPLCSQPERQPPARRGPALGTFRGSCGRRLLSLTRERGTFRGNDTVAPHPSRRLGHAWSERPRPRVTAAKAACLWCVAPPSPRFSPWEPGGCSGLSPGPRGSLWQRKGERVGRRLALRASAGR